MAHLNRRVVVVTTGYGDPWDEEHLVTRRLAGALACEADVDVLVAQGRVTEISYDGAIRVVHLPTIPVEGSRSGDLRLALLGPAWRHGGTFSSSTTQSRQRLGDRLPKHLQHELVRQEGGESPELWNWLSDGGYDVVVFVGYGNAATHQGMAAVPDRCRVVLWPVAQDDPFLYLARHDEVFERADRILAVTHHEKALLSRRLGPGATKQAAFVGFPLRINPAAIGTEPHGREPAVQPVVLVRDWRRTTRSVEMTRWWRAWENSDRRDEEASASRVRLRLVGPGAERLSKYGGVPLAASRTDVWRWMAHAVAVLEPDGDQVLGREVLEAMLCGAPVLVRDRPGAALDHVRAGHGGLWFRTDHELQHCVEQLLDREVRDQLGAQGAAYVAEHHGDPDAFVRVVTGVVFGDEAVPLP